ncbi:MAG: hypothetical protein MUO88_17440, partial [Desulfobacterales bacterium]|nr:hypothetical protein [Desulfobacterales bacterium]
MYEIIDNVVTLKIPSMLALELFRQGVLSQTNGAVFRKAEVLFSQMHHSLSISRSGSGKILCSQNEIDR